jgi:hypothetical protein
MVSSVKWVDEVITDAPYAINEEFMNKLFTEHNVDYIIHGDDPCLLPDGSDAYAHAKKAGRYKQIKRTEGVSSTDIVGNAFFCTLSIARIFMPYSRNLSLLLACYCFSICTEAVWKDGWMDGWMDHCHLCCKCFTPQLLSLECGLLLLLLANMKERCFCMCVFFHSIVRASLIH